MRGGNDYLSKDKAAQLAVETVEKAIDLYKEVCASCNIFYFSVSRHPLALLLLQKVLVTSFNNKYD